MHSINHQSPVLDPESVRSLVHAMWASVAGHWAEHADYVDARGEAATALMLDRVAPAPGDQVLELACGPGSTGMAAARLVGPSGHVVLSDVAAPMAAMAGARAEALGLANTASAVLDLEAIDVADHSFDVVLCREGLMFAVDPARAAEEIHRVLRPGGRVAVAVWGPPAENPWLSLVFEAVTAETGRPVPPPGVPGPFSLSDRGALVALLSTAGFDEVRLEDLPTPAKARSFDEWWSRTRAMAGPLATVVAQLPAASQASLTDRLRAVAAPFTTPDGVELPGLALVVSATRP